MIKASDEKRSTPFPIILVQKIDITTKERTNSDNSKHNRSTRSIIRDETTYKSIIKDEKSDKERNLTKGTASRW